MFVYCFCCSFCVFPLSAQVSGRLKAWNWLIGGLEPGENRIWGFEALVLVEDEWEMK